MTIKRIIKRFSLPAIAAFFLLMTSSSAWGQSCNVSTSPTFSAGSLTYTQNFNSLSTSTTTPSTVLPAGFALDEQDSGGDDAYIASTGSDTSGNTYSYANGTATTDRALGSLTSGSVQPIYYGVCLRNNTGSAIISLTISYRGEQYRLGQSSQPNDLLAFSYNPNATTATLVGAATGFTNIATLNFTSPVTSGTAGARDGNASGNFTNKNGNITGLNIANNGFVFIRFADNDVSGSDNGLAVDDLSITATINTAPTISNIADQTGIVGTTQTVNFTVADNETLTGATVSATSSNTTVAPNPTVNYTSGNTNGSLSITPSVAGTTTITVRVTDASGAFSEDTFVLTVNAPPTIMATSVTRVEGNAVSNSQIATVTDNGGNGNVAVTVNGGATATVNGVTVSNIVNNNGTITADVVAVCGATNASFTLTASDGSLSSTATLTVTVTPAPASKLVFSQQPTDTQANVVITPPVTVQIQNQCNSVVTSSNASVTIAIGTNPSGGTLSGTTTVAAVNGVATFNNLSINNAGNGYTLTASSAGLTGATSNAFNLTPAPTSPTGTGAASPSTVQAGGTTLLTVAVTPGANPASTGIAVTGNLTSIGGSATQQFYDDGTNGDVTAGDNIFSYLATVAINTPVGSKTITTTITDAQGRTGTADISLTVTAAPTFTINDVSTAEGNGGTTNFVFTVTRSGNTTGASAVNFTTADGTATVADGDYTAANGTLNFAAGETTMTITVSVNPDTTTEPDETFSVILSAATGATIADDTGVGTIQNDETDSTGIIPAGTYTNLNIGAAGATLGGNVTVTGNLAIGDGVITTDAFTLTLETTADYTRGAGFVEGDQTPNSTDGGLTKLFPVGNGQSFIFPVGTVSGDDDGYTPVSLDNLNITTAGYGLTVKAVDRNSPAITRSNITRYWQLTEIGNITTDLTFTYLFGDQSSIVGDISNLKVYRNNAIECGGNASCVTPATSTTNGTGTVAGKSEFSPWGIGVDAPTAAEVTVGGRVTQRNGRGIFRARVTMIDSQGVSRTAHTNPFGFYRFEDVAAGEDYIFTVSHLRYQFAQPTQAQFIGEETEGINFTALDIGRIARPPMPDVKIRVQPVEPEKKP